MHDSLVLVSEWDWETPRPPRRGWTFHVMSIVVLCVVSFVYRQYTAHVQTIPMGLSMKMSHGIKTWTSAIFPHCWYTGKTNIIPLTCVYCHKVLVCCSVVWCSVVLWNSVAMVSQQGSCLCWSGLTRGDHCAMDHASPSPFTCTHTETGGIMIMPRPSPDDSAPKPGFPTRPFWGIKPVLVNEKVRAEVSLFHVQTQHLSFEPGKNCIAVCSGFYFLMKKISGTKHPIAWRVYNFKTSIFGAHVLGGASVRGPGFSSTLRPYQQTKIIMP